MAREVHTLTLAAPDWGKVAVAVQRHLNWLRNMARTNERPTPESRLRDACEIATVSRIKTEIIKQRRGIRYGRVTDQSASKLCDGINHVGPVVRAQRQTDDKRSWIDGEYCEACRVYMFPNT